MWNKKDINEWYSIHEWLVGCNYLPSSAINQLEMFQNESFDLETNKREISWASHIGFNSLRIYLHDLLWQNKENFKKRLNEILALCEDLNIKPILVLFDDCHRPFPKLGKQPLPVRGVHNSGWKQSPGHEIVREIAKGNKEEEARLKLFTQEILDDFRDDERILLWDLYNEPGQFGIGDESNILLGKVWDWAFEVRPSQPLTACLDGTIGNKNIQTNKEKSDVITFHVYEHQKVIPIIEELKKIGRPLICTEYMAREFGTTFEFTLPIFKEHNIGAYNWGLVAGKSQTHFGWETILKIKELKDKGDFVKEGEPLPEPDIWFHDILRINGSPYNQSEIDFIKTITKEQQD